VTGDFFCNANSLTTLEGGPLEVGRDFRCSYNKITSLKGAPNSVGRYFNCANNQLTSLEGAPPIDDDYIRSNGNPISQESIDRIIALMDHSKIKLEQAVAYFWEIIPDDDKAYLAKHNPDLSPDEIKGYEALARLKKRVL
jgi:hypothetical protein